jgi:hypothetical protein
MGVEQLGDLIPSQATVSQQCIGNDLDLATRCCDQALGGLRHPHHLQLDLGVTVVATQIMPGHLPINQIAVVGDRTADQFFCGRAWQTHCGQTLDRDRDADADARR